MRQFLGLGLGAIQAGLFLYEAQQSGQFSRLAVTSRRAAMVASLRRAAGTIALNIAHADSLEQAQIRGVDSYHSAAGSEDNETIIEAIAQASDIATALRSVEDYSGDTPYSPQQLLAAGLCRKARQDMPKAVIYAAENHNHAAELLEAAVYRCIPAAEQPKVRQYACFVNTVIGKMSGSQAPAAYEASRGRLEPITPDADEAYLVEAFNAIRISRVPPSFGSGFAFQQHDDLLPFEEAKLYGHNATHALLAYLGRFSSAQHMHALTAYPALLNLAREAFLEESGAALQRKYAGLDPLFSPEGYQDYAEDLLQRMVNPYLQDSIARVCRDPLRKLAWHDRLIGTMRLAASQGIEARRYALAAAAAVHMWCEAIPRAIPSDAEGLETLLNPLWPAEEAAMKAHIYDQLSAALTALPDVVASWR